MILLHAVNGLKNSIREQVKSSQYEREEVSSVKVALSDDVRLS